MYIVVHLFFLSMVTSSPQDRLDWWRWVLVGFCPFPLFRTNNVETDALTSCHGWLLTISSVRLLWMHNKNFWGSPHFHWLFSDSLWREVNGKHQCRRSQVSYWRCDREMCCCKRGTRWIFKWKVDKKTEHEDSLHLHSWETICIFHKDHNMKADFGGQKNYLSLYICVFLMKIKYIWDKVRVI